MPSGNDGSNRIRWVLGLALMPIRVVTGPAFAGKTQKVQKVRRPGDITLDTTSIWKAFYDPDDVVRSATDGQIANAMKRTGLDKAVAQGRDGWLIVAERDPVRLKRWLDAAGQQKAWLVTESWAELRKRARKAGPECEELLTKWDGYEDDPDFQSLVEPWSEDEMRTIHDIETQYRSALEGVTFREAGCDVQHRCLTDKAELRAEGGTSRVVTGIAVRYGDEARLGGFRERIAKGALGLPANAANLTMQHDRAMPLGLLEWEDDDDALRFRTELSDGARQDQALQDVRAGLLRGASLEFMPEKERLLETDETKGPLYEIVKAKVMRALARGRRRVSAVVHQPPAGAASSPDCAADGAVHYSGVMSDHELVSIEVDPPVLPPEVENHALAASRETALAMNTYRRLLLKACAVAVERYCDRMFWPGENVARTSTAVVIVRSPSYSVAACPLYPDVSGVAAALTSLRRWDDEAWVTLSAPDDYRMLPGERFLVGRSGQYEIVSSLTAPATAPPSAIEAVARLWAYRETLRPGDLTNVGGEQQVLAGGMMKSGAAEALRGVRWRVTV